MVVCRLCTSEPWPISVMAKQPASATGMVSGRKVAWWNSVPRLTIAPPHSPCCTPLLIASDRSPRASISKCATDSA